MGKNIKKEQKDQQIQAKSEEILAKIEADREAGNLPPAEEQRTEIREAKEKLKEARKKMDALEKQRQLAAKKNDPETHTYSAEEKKRVLENAKNATARYMKLKDFVERYDRMQKINKLEQMLEEMRKREKEAKADAVKKDEE